MNHPETLTKDTIKLFNNSNVFFGFDVRDGLETDFTRRIGNGLKSALVGELEDLHEIAVEHKIEPVARLAKESAHKANSAEKFSMDNIGEIMKLSFSPIAAAIPYHQIEELYEQSIDLLDTVGKYIPKNEGINIGWEISSKRNLDTQAAIQNKSSGYLVPFDLFLNRLREPFLSRAVIIDQDPNMELQAKKMLLLMLKRLFWYSSRLVEEWRNVESPLTKNAEAADRALKIIRQGKWFVLEYKKKKEPAMLKWIKALHLFAARNGESFVKVAVLADYRQIDTPLRPRLRGYFGAAGSTFERFPDGIGTFSEAIRKYDRELAEGIERRKQIRTGLVGGDNSASVKQTAKTNTAAV